MLWIAAIFLFQHKVEGCDEQEEWQEAGDGELQALDVEGADGDGDEAGEGDDLQLSRERGWMSSRSTRT
jgi:hypothetical protein